MRFGQLRERAVSGAPSERALGLRMPVRSNRDRAIVGGSTHSVRSTSPTL